MQIRNDLLRTAETNTASDTHLDQSTVWLQDGCLVHSVEAGSQLGTAVRSFVLVEAGSPVLAEADIHVLAEAENSVEAGTPVVEAGTPVLA